MPKLDSYLNFVKEQQAIHEKLARKFADQQWRQDLHINTARQFSNLAGDIVLSQKALDEAQERNAQRGKPVLEKLPLTPEDLEGLPEELLKELSISDADKMEFQIINLIDQAGGVLSLDRILIGLYKTTGEIYKRHIMTSKLYRMVQKSMIFAVPARKGVYSTDEIAQNQEPNHPIGGTSDDHEQTKSSLSLEDAMKAVAPKPIGSVLKAES